LWCDNVQTQQHSIVTWYWCPFLTLDHDSTVGQGRASCFRKDLARSVFLHIERNMFYFQRFVNIMSTTNLCHECKSINCPSGCGNWVLLNVIWNKKILFYNSDLKRPHLLINARFEVVPESKEWWWSSEFVTVYSLWNSPESRVSNACVSEWAFMCVFWGRVTTERCGGGAWCLTTCFVWISIATLTDTSKRDGLHTIQDSRLGNHSIFISKISIKPLKTQIWYNQISTCQDKYHYYSSYTNCSKVWDQYVFLKG